MGADSTPARDDPSGDSGGALTADSAVAHTGFTLNASHVHGGLPLYLLSVSHRPGGACAFIELNHL
jgi:hypothetical protein